MCLNENYADLTVSHGTMRCEDLRDSFLCFLRGVKEVLDEEQTGRYLKFESLVKSGKFDEEDLESVWFLLEEIAPEDCYFGSHPGDGSDFGFWKIEEEF